MELPLAQTLHDDKRERAGRSPEHFTFGKNVVSWDGNGLWQPNFGDPASERRAEVLWHSLMLGKFNRFHASHSESSVMDLSQYQVARSCQVPELIMVSEQCVSDC
jgi:hypothetical protein